MGKLFISYSRVDTNFVKELKKRLEKADPDYEIWQDTEDIVGGDDWWQAILNAIGASKIVIYVLSNESIASEYCQAEFAEAQRLQKPVITVIARARTVFTEELSSIHAIDMSNGINTANFRLLKKAIEKKLQDVTIKEPLSAIPTPKPDAPVEKPVTPVTETASVIDVKATEPLSAIPTSNPSIFVKKPTKPKNESISGQNLGLFISFLGVIAVIIAALITIMPQMLDRWDAEASQTAIALIASQTAETSQTAEASTQTAIASETSAANSTNIAVSATIATSNTGLSPSPRTEPSSTSEPFIPTNTPVPSTATYTPAPASETPIPTATEMPFGISPEASEAVVLAPTELWATTTQSTPEAEVKLELVSQREFLNFLVEIDSAGGYTEENFPTEVFINTTWTYASWVSTVNPEEMRRTLEANLRYDGDEAVVGVSFIEARKYCWSLEYQLPTFEELDEVSQLLGYEFPANIEWIEINRAVIYENGQAITTTRLNHDFSSFRCVRDRN